jgi:hypothetical protein
VSESSAAERRLDERLDALVRSECSLEAFIEEMTQRCTRAPDAAWELLSITDQYFRRRRLSLEAHRTITRHFGRDALSHLARPLRAPPLIDAAPPGDGPIAVPMLGRMLRERYVVESYLGDGGRGIVVKALDRFRLDLPMASRHVALKVLRDATSTPDALAAFRQEFQHSQVLSHPNIVKVFEIDRDANTFFYTMDLLEGNLLCRLVTRSGGKLAASLALAIVRDVGAAIVHAHSRGVVHGKLSTRKVFIIDDGELRVFGFGTAPDADRGDDLFALAALAFELFAGTPLLAAADDERDPRCWDEAFRSRRRPPTISRRRWKALELALSSNARQRSTSVREWLEEFGVEGAAKRLPGRFALPEPPPRRSRRLSAWPAALVGAALLGFGSARFWPDPNVTPAAPDGAAASTTSTVAAARERSSLLSGSPLSLVGALQLTRAEVDAGGVGATGSNGASTAHRRSYEIGGSKRGIRISASSYTVLPAQNLVSIGVRRTPGVEGPVDFVWWTENATAKAGQDFTSFGQKLERLPAGTDGMAFLIPIADRAKREDNRKFYVVLAQAGRPPGSPQRAQVLIRADPHSAHVVAASRPYMVAQGN